ENRPSLLRAELMVNRHSDAYPILVRLGQVHQLVEHFANLVYINVLDGLFGLGIAVAHKFIRPEHFLDEIGVNERNSELPVGFVEPAIGAARRMLGRRHSDLFTSAKQLNLPAARLLAVDKNRLLAPGDLL